MLTRKLSINRVSQVGLTGGGQFGLNGQKLHENEKISIFGSKQWGTWGREANFLASRGDLLSPQQIGETLINNEIPVIFDQT